jgi:hypothetical protein
MIATESGRMSTPQPVASFFAFTNINPKPKLASETQAGAISMEINNAM